MVNNPSAAEERQIKYKKRVARIRNIIKNIVFENAALCDQVAHMQETILCVKEERKFLMRKLIELDNDIPIDAKPNAMEQQQQQQHQKQQQQLQHKQANTTATGTPQTPSPQAPRTRKPYKKRTQTSCALAPKTPVAIGDTTATTSKESAAPKKPKKSHKKQLQKKPPNHQHDQPQHQQLQTDSQQNADMNDPPVEYQLNGNETEHVQTISIDDLGRPIYPIQMGDNLAIFDLGEIVASRIHYQNEHWLYPVGYMATRIYGHIKEPQRKCVYTCKITDGGDYPLFEIIPESDMNFAIAGPTPDLCHAALLQTMNSHSNGRHVEVRPKGEWFFGLGHPTVVTLLLQQPQVPFCEDFVGFMPDALSAEYYGDATVNYEALQRYMGTSVYHHAVPEVKEEPPDQLLEQVVVVV